MATKLTPLHDRVLVRREKASEKTAGGLYIPDVAKEKSQEGIIVAVGKGKSNDKGETFPLAVKPGDRVLFGKYSGSEIPIRIDDEDYLILREEEIFGVIEGESKSAKKAS